jgi:hypothetical protein
MTPFHVALACLASLALGALLTTLLLRLRNTAHGKYALASLDVLNGAFTAYEAELTALRGEIERARAQRDEEARKAREYFDRIDGIVKEADECRRLLVKTGAEHGAAQAMMLAEIDSVVHQYGALAKQYQEATGKPAPRPEPRLNAAIQVVAADFREAHVAPYQKGATRVPVEASPPTGG